MPLPPALQPPDSHREMMLANIRNGNEILEFLQLCEACGLPVQDRRDVVTAHTEFAQTFLRNFFPDS